MYDLNFTIADGGYTLCGETWRGTNIWIEHVKLYCVAKGRGWTTIGGKKTKFLPGKLYFVPPRAEASFASDSPLGIFWLHFSPQSPTLLRLLQSDRSIVTFSPELFHRWSSTMKLIPRFLTNGSTDDACRIHGMILDLVGAVLSKRPKENPKAIAEYDRLLPALKLLDSIKGEAPSLREIAKTVSLSPEHFHRLFRKIFHITPLRYITARRMTKARQLFAEAQHSVSEVAEQCGYEDALYFSRVFHQYFGVRPSKTKGSHQIHIVP